MGEKRFSATIRAMGEEKARAAETDGDMSTNAHRVRKRYEALADRLAESETTLEERTLHSMAQTFIDLVEVDTGLLDEYSPRVSEIADAVVDSAQRFWEGDGVFPFTAEDVMLSPLVKLELQEVVERNQREVLNREVRDVFAHVDNDEVHFFDSFMDLHDELDRRLGDDGISRSDVDALLELEFSTRSTIVLPALERMLQAGIEEKKLEDAIEDIVHASDFGEVLHVLRSHGVALEHALPGGRLTLLDLAVRAQMNAQWGEFAAQLQRLEGVELDEEDVGLQAFRREYEQRIMVAKEVVAAGGHFAGMANEYLNHLRMSAQQFEDGHFVYEYLGSQLVEALQ